MSGQVLVDVGTEAVTLLAEVEGSECSHSSTLAERRPDSLLTGRRGGRRPEFAVEYQRRWLRPSARRYRDRAGRLLLAQSDELVARYRGTDLRAGSRAGRLAAFARKEEETPKPSMVLRPMWTRPPKSRCKCHPNNRRKEAAAPNPRLSADWIDQGAILRVARSL